jgi:hypothetical protein
MPNEPLPARPVPANQGGKTLGEQALTGAQRQTRYRLRHPAAPVIR